MPTILPCPVHHYLQWPFNIIRDDSQTHQQAFSIGLPLDLSLSGVQFAKLVGSVM